MLMRWLSQSCRDRACSYVIFHGWCIDGRLSSSDPNVQNIPIRTAEGRQIVQPLSAPGHKLIRLIIRRLNYGWWRMLPMKPSMIEAFQAGVDIHARTASEVFGILLETRLTAKQDAAPRQLTLALFMAFRRLAGPPAWHSAK